MKIIYHGTICEGQGDFSKDHTIEAKVLLEDKGWISTIEKGTMNIRIPIEELSGPDKKKLDRSGVKVFDLNESFPPHIYLNHQEIVGNTLSKRRKPNSQTGDGQFWRCLLKIEKTGDEIKTYMLRRVGSGYRDRIELIAEYNLRNKHNLVDGDRVMLEIFANL